MKSAVVHEWLHARSGSEVLFEHMAAALPEADVFALTVDNPAGFDFGGRKVRTTVLDRVPILRSSRALQLPFMPPAWKVLRRQPYDLVVTSSHAFAREFVRPFDGVHLSYVHAPMRYAWSPGIDRRASRAGYLSGPARAVLRRLDQRSVKAVDSFAANSRAVAARVQEFYGRGAEVIHPPVDVEFFSGIEPNKRGYLLAASRMVPYKRLDLSIRVAAALDMPLVVAGWGSGEAELRSLAAKIHPSGVTFSIRPSSIELRRLMADAAAFLMPAEEDFGIVMVEALAAGTPVVGLEAGGALDIVSPGENGDLGAAQDIDAMLEAVQRVLVSPPSVGACRASAERFSSGRFRRAIQQWCEGVVA